MSHGGVRKGAGRRSSFGCKTTPMRIPDALVEAVQTYIHNQGYQIPLYECKVSAGMPLPADDAVQANLDLNQYLIRNPKTTFLVRAFGLSMLNAGIHENDILIVDRSIPPTPGKILVAAIDGQLTVKRLHKDNSGKLLFMPENPDFVPIEVSEANHVHIWGVVTSVVHSL